jgi:hypothetical protein
LIPLKRVQKILVFIHEDVVIEQGLLVKAAGVTPRVCKA